MTTLNFTEDSYEQTLIALFQDMGYQYQCGYDIERDDYRNPLYEEYLEGALSRINKGVSSYGINELLKAIRQIEGTNLLQQNEVFMKYLQDGVPVEDKMPDGAYRNVLCKLIDFENVESNTFHVVNQWTVEEYKKKRPDMVVFVNGLPLVVIELKSATSETAGVQDAYLQIRNYQQDIPSLFVYNCFNVISDMLESRAGTLTAKESRYMEWKTEDGKVESTQMVDYGTFFRGMFQKERLLDIIKNFICFDKNEGATGKILTAYHQYFAVNKAINRAMLAVNGNGKIGVFWHTQGSGKSLSMVFFAHQLITKLPEVTIVVVTDRKDLDDQLYGQFSRCADFLRQVPLKAGSRAELGELLKDRKSGGIIFTTIQKFEEGEKALSPRRNIVVMSDEAHRSQYGDEHWDNKAMEMKKGFAQKMRDALPGASFIGFTGTPISNKDKDTEEVFGNYIDIYDMSQAVQDGATRPVYYESRVINLNLDDNVLKELDAEFDRLEEDGATDEQILLAKQENSHLETLLGEDVTINSLVDDIITHYEENRASVCCGKAMIVALTRKIAIKIYNRILELRPDWKEKVKVVMSSSNKDPEEWQEIIGNEAYKKELAKRFKDNDDPLKIVIVRDMWLTGFDVPSLATMYVYKAMSGHNLMQAIARVNRVFPGKEGGLVVDYIGIAQALRNAMKQYTPRDQQKFGDPDIAKTALLKWKELMENCRDLMHGYDYMPFFERDNSKKADAIVGGVNWLSMPEREERKKDVIDFAQQLHNATTLCRSLLNEEEKTEVCFFDALRVMLRKLGQKGKISKKEINDRINELLKASIKCEGVINLFQDQKTEFSLFDDAFMEEIKKMKEKNIAIEILKGLLRDKLSEKTKVNVVQSELFSEMLNKSLSNYLKGLLTNEEVIEELLEIAKQMRKEQEEGNDLGLNDEEKAFYDALSKPEGVRQAYSDDEFVAMTKELTETLRKNRTIDWNHKESARAQMRVLIKRLLKKYKYPPAGAKEAIEIVMKQCDNWADNEENFTEEVVLHRPYKYTLLEDDGVLIAAES